MSTNETIDLTPTTWEELANIAVMLIINGTEHGHKEGRNIVLSMARKLDALREQQEEEADND